MRSNMDHLGYGKIRSSRLFEFVNENIWTTTSEQQWFRDYLFV